MEIFQLEKGKYYNQRKGNITIREMKILQLGNGKYFQSELVIWEMAEEEEEKIDETNLY